MSDIIQLVFSIGKEVFVYEKCNMIQIKCIMYKLYS